MSGSLPALQQHAESASTAFCQRYVKPRGRSRYGYALPASPRQSTTSGKTSAQSKFYRPRNHTASPFYKIVRSHFDNFEQEYSEKYQERYGYWRPVIRLSIDKFITCGDLKEGFARVRCPDCKEEFFVAFSCRQRSCCPSCDQKRALLLAHRLNEEVLAEVPHRQWVFTIPKRLRVYLRYDRKLLGKLCRAAYDTICEIFKQEIDGDCGVPAMVATAQTFGDLVHWHPHMHSIIPEGIFTENGHFVHIPDVWKHKADKSFAERVSTFLLAEHKINDEIVTPFLKRKVFGAKAPLLLYRFAGSMRSWKHSGFSVDNSVRIAKGDKAGMQRLVQYIARCPFSLTRMVSITKDGKILYRASHAKCIPFPLSGDTTLMKGMPRNYELYDPLDFLAEVTQHIPNKGEHQVRYYGFYSNKKRGQHLKKMAKPAPAPGDTEPDTPYRRKCRMTWAALIKAVFEVDPLKCPVCGGTMKIVAFIEEEVVIKKILKHCNLWKEEVARPPPTNQLAENTITEQVYDYSFIEPA